LGADIAMQAAEEARSQESWYLHEMMGAVERIEALTGEHYLTMDEAEDEAEASVAEGESEHAGEQEPAGVERRPGGVALADHPGTGEG